jgi:hypothetical protein
MALLVTKSQLRSIIADMIRDNRAAGVPEDGVAEILAQWMIGHLSGGTLVVSEGDAAKPAPHQSSKPAADDGSHPTLSQLKELQRLAVRPRSSFGSATTRIQNNLVRAGLAHFIDDDGAIRGLPNLGYSTCAISEKGRRALAKHTAPRRRVV